MSLSDNPSKFKHVHISKVEAGVTLVNLGTLLEVEEHSLHYCLIVERMSQKQVIKFDKDTLLVVE
ncbi:hypothetical protein WAE58_04525 [Pedobacter panaciterrae]|uniref:Uncharacterized protein n=1 Tax=Pedobacter panaciterrae TaxID=363849 RepID=A0ABU8NHM0_9SPHI